MQQHLNPGKSSYAAKLRIEQQVYHLQNGILRRLSILILILNEEKVTPRKRESKAYPQSFPAKPGRRPRQPNDHFHVEFCKLVLRSTPTWKTDRA